MSLTKSTINIQVTGKDVRTGDLVNNTANLSYSFTQDYSSSEATLLYTDRRTLTATTESLNLVNATLTGPSGNTLVFGSLLIFVVKNSSSTDSLTIFGGVDGITSQTIEVSPGGCVACSVDYTIDGTHKLFKVDSGSATITYDIILIGQT